MEIKLSETIEMPVQCIKPIVDISQIENFSHFSAVRLAKKYFERNGMEVLEGGNFENNFILYFYDGIDRQMYDEYIKVKLGKANVTSDEIEYCEKILKFIPEADVRTLLSICRMCSYAGDPAFPDIISMRNGWKINYVLFDELSASQKMFLILSKLLKMDVEVIRLGSAEREEVLTISMSEVFSAILNERRAKNIMEGLEENIMSARSLLENSSSKKNIQDEVDYLELERAKNPLLLFYKWKINGVVSSSELKEFIKFVASNSRHNFDNYLKELENDPTFSKMISLKTEDAMRSKAEYMQKKFGIGQTRSKLLLNFF